MTLVSRSRRMLVDWVAAQQVDLGIGLMFLDHPSVEFRAVGAFDGVCALHPRHPLAAKRSIGASDLDGERFISLGAEESLTRRSKVSGSGATS